MHITILLVTSTTLYGFLLAFAAAMPNAVKGWQENAECNTQIAAYASPNWRKLKIHRLGTWPSKIGFIAIFIISIAVIASSMTGWQRLAHADLSRPG